MALRRYMSVGFRLSVHLALPIVWDQVMLQSSSGIRTAD